MEPKTIQDLEKIVHDLEVAVKTLDRNQETHRQDDINFHEDMIASHADLKEVVIKQTLALETFTEKNAPIARLYESSGLMGRFILRAFTLLGSIIVIIVGIIQIMKDWGHK